MSPSFLYALAVCSAVFSVAVIAKVAALWKRPDARYEFKMWDGGLMFRGKTIGRQAAVAFAIVMAVLSLILLYLATEHAKRRRTGAAPAAARAGEKLARADLDCQPRA